MLCFRSASVIVLAGRDEGHVVSRMFLIVAPGHHAVVDNDLSLTVVISNIPGYYASCFIIPEAGLSAVAVDECAVCGIVLSAHLPYTNLIGVFLIVDGDGDLHIVIVGCVNSNL